MEMRGCENFRTFAVVGRNVSGVLPDGYGDDRLMTLPLVGDVADMRLGVIRPKDVPLTGYGEKFAAILKDIVSKLNQEA